MSPRAGTERYRFTVPDKDTSVLEWIDEQENLGASLRVVIREYIERNGVTDATCRPVAQLPRRGRPPTEQAEPGSEDEQGDTAPEPVVVTQPVPVEQTEDAPSHDEGPDERPDQGPAEGQYDINELFSRSR